MKGSRWDIVGFKSWDFINKSRKKNLLLFLKQDFSKCSVSQNCMIRISQGMLVGSFLGLSWVLDSWVFPGTLHLQRVEIWNYIF